MMPELRVRHQPCLKPRRRPREAEGRKDHERHRRQQRQKGAQRAESERRPATDETEVPLHAATGLAELMLRAHPAHVLCAALYCFVPTLLSMPGLFTHLTSPPQPRNP